MRLLNAWTLEPDDCAIAVSEILDQLDLENTLQKNSVGLLTCSYDFVESGAVKAICEALPFDVIGGTTLTNANNAEAGTMLLCLTVFTADDCEFSSCVTASLRDDLQGEISAGAKTAKTNLGGTPKMALALFPMFGVGGEMMLGALDDALEGVPIFGTVACDHDTAEYSNTYTVYNGECFRDRLAFFLISGNVNPRFVVAATSEQNLRKQQAVITSSDGCLIREINNMTAKEYFKSIGMSTGKGIEGMSSVPFVVDYGDGSQPVARAIFGLNEDGSALCGGYMPEGSTLYIGRMDEEDIFLTAENSINELLNTPDLNGIILFPCLGRNMVLVMDPLAEANLVQSLIGDRVPWHLAYSAGECCPVYYAEDGRTVNRFHNFTFIGCAI
jgi:FIST N domain./FIST C domain.